MDLCVHTYTTSPMNLYTVPFGLLLITCILLHTCLPHLLFPHYHYPHTSLSCPITTSTSFLNSKQLPLNTNDMVKGGRRTTHFLQINRAERKGLSDISRLVWDMVSLVAYILRYNYSTTATTLYTASYSNVIIILKPKPIRFLVIVSSKN